MKQKILDKCKEILRPRDAPYCDSHPLDSLRNYRQAYREGEIAAAKELRQYLEEL